MEFTVITAILIMVGYYFLFRVRSSKPKKQEPVRYIRRQVRRSAGHPVEKSSGKPPGPAPAPESKTTEAAGPPSVLDKVKGWRPMSRSDIEVETLWRLEHVLREIPDMGQTPVVRIDYEMEPREVSAALASNPFYAARILKTVNSASMGLQHRIDSLPRAITFLGYNQVKNLIFQHAIRDSLSGMKSSGAGDGDGEKFIESRKFWQHSHAVSVCADYLLCRVLKSNRDVGLITTAALMHDIGWVVYPQYDEETAFTLLKRLQQAADTDNTVEMEEQAFGFNHLILGRMLAEQWDIPAPVCKLIGLHHCATFGLGGNDDSGMNYGACLIARAEALAAELGYPNPLPEPVQLSFDIQPVLGSALGQVSGSMPKLRQELEKTMKFIEEFFRD